MAVETKTIDTMTQQAGKYLTFALAEETYGVEILKVREIIGIMDITAVPKSPDHVRGVVNLRGKVVPVVDLRTRFGLDAVEATSETCIIVVVVGDTEIGVIVDRVREVLDIGADDIESAPSFGTTVDTSFILGLGKMDGQVTILLDITKVLQGEAIAL